MLNRLRAALAAVGFAALVALPPAAATVATTPTTLSTSAWTDLGTGPMFLGLAYGWSAVYKISDSAPTLADRGWPISAAGENIFTPSHVWAIAVGAASSPPVVLTAPISVGAAAIKPANTPASQADPGMVVRSPDLGTPGDAACATDTGSCDVNALLQRQAQRLTSLISAIGNPFQAGGAIANTAFGVTGTTGVDYSANKPTLPNVGANFGSTGVYANYVLIATVPASSTRNEIEVENISGAQIVVVLDDGTATAGSQPNNATIKAYAGGATAGAQGGAWSSQAFKGRVQIYAPSAAASVAANVR